MLRVKLQNLTSVTPLAQSCLRDKVYPILSCYKKSFLAHITSHHIASSLLLSPSTAVTFDWPRLCALMDSPQWMPFFQSIWMRRAVIWKLMDLGAPFPAERQKQADGMEYDCRGSLQNADEHLQREHLLQLLAFTPL